MGGLRARLTMRTVICLLLVLVATAQMGMPKKPKSRPIASDLPHISCAVCEALASSLHNQVSAMPAPDAVKGRVSSRGKASKGIVNEADVSNLLEHACNPKEKAGRWTSSFDLVSEDGTVKLEPQVSPGHCKRECETVAQSCTDLLEKIEDNLDDLQVALWKGKSRRELTKRLCEEWGEVCPARNPEKKLVREVDEEFKAKTEKDIEMDELMAKTAGIPGMGGSQMFDRDDMAGMGGGEL